MGNDGDDSPGEGNAEPTDASGEPTPNDLDEPLSWERMDRVTEAETETEGETDE